VVIAEHAAGVTLTGPLCSAIATVLVFVARNAGKREGGTVKTALAIVPVRLPSIWARLSSLACRCCRPWWSRGKAGMNAWACSILAAGRV